jgi:hypothetical protein
VALLALAAAVLGVILVVRHPSGATAGCDAPSDPPPLLPSADDTPLLLWPEAGVKLTIDGAAPVSAPDSPTHFAPGKHQVRASCGEKISEHVITLEPYKPGAIHVRCDGVPRFTLLGLGGDDAATRNLAAQLPKESGLRMTAAAQERLEAQEQRRRKAVLIQRWNLLTERYGRVVAVVGREAAGPLAAANQRFEELSQGFKEAHQKEDADAALETLRAGEETLRVFVNAARHARPDDCEFQRRVTQSF